MSSSLTPNNHARLFHGRPLEAHRWDGFLVKGDEPTEVLRTKALALAEVCPQGLRHERCPFRWIESLARGQREELIEHLDRNGLLQLFAMEQACRFESEHPRDACSGPSRPPL